MEGQPPLKDDCMIYKSFEDGLAPLPPAMVMVPSPCEGESEQEFMHFGVGYTHQPYLVTVYFGRKPVTNRSFPCRTRVIWVPGGIYLN